MPNQYTIDDETIATLSGLALAVALRYVPQIAGGWDGLDRYAKMLILASLCLTVGVALTVAQCGLDSACLNANLSGALRASLMAFVGSQAGYLAVRKPGSPQSEIAAPEND